MTTFSILRFGLRVALAAALGRAASRIVVADAPFSMSAVVLGALMVVAAIWLLCGVRTRIVTLLAVALYTGYALMLPPAEAGRPGTIAGLAIVAALALPLVAVGGARIGRSRSGWPDQV